MEELKIYEYQAKQIEDTFRIVARILESKDRKTSVDRDIMQSWAMIKDVLNKDITNVYSRNTGEIINK
jgi:predicted transcriptional regulator